VFLKVFPFSLSYFCFFHLKKKKKKKNSDCFCFSFILNLLPLQNLTMQGRRSQNLAVIPYNPEIERTIRQPRRPKEDSEEEEEFEVEEKMAENQPEQEGR
jgi:hypothetical protein